MENINFKTQIEDVVDSLKIKDSVSKFSINELKGRLNELENNLVLIEKSIKMITLTENKTAMKNLALNFNESAELISTIQDLLDKSKNNLEFQKNSLLECIDFFTKASN